ncbi:MAG: hypothetical protein KDJ35_06345 [Alphaproteobacteria bacterium]|nr:hypothetical protein [Alphaproteobacteria bacterium]
MFGLMKSKNPYEAVAHDIYAAALSHARDAAFYSDYGVEDNFEGRFEVLCLHIFIVMHVALAAGVDEAFNQALFDIMFADMDQSLRQLGKGDMGVPKHMRRMMTGFNGRMNAYEELYQDKAAFVEAVRRNVYNGRADAPADKIARYVRANIKKQNAKSIVQGRASFVPITGKA